eukprot:TRINITY_DN8139_c0_g1_i10.p1 TRINITY_DN8139_c0_g1~~TRINITY_DN8139_c0_g1_i10.p1  ORF type:complete len:800 (-),score=89.06 TRINITY_DN8139_c0_g1_i10:194-2593(-)
MISRAYLKKIRQQNRKNDRHIGLVSYDSLTFLEVIGNNGESEVYRGLCNGHNVVIRKYLSSQNMDVGWDTLKLYAEFLSNIRHPGILLYMGVCHSSQASCIMMQYMPNKSLSAVISEYNRFPHAKIVESLIDICRGLLFLHSFEPVVVHGNLTSRNIVFDEFYSAKISDMQPWLVQRNVGSYVKKNNIAWTAPEVLRGDKPSVYSDRFSFGMITWEICHWMTPFQNENNTDSLLQAIAHNGKRELIDELLCFELKDVITNLWSDEPTGRSAFVDVIKELRGITTKACHGDLLEIRKRIVNHDVRKAGAVVVVIIDNIDLLWAELADFMTDVILTFNSIMSKAIQDVFGTEGRTETKLKAAYFQDSAAAVRFAISLIMETHNASWPTQLLDHRACRPISNGSACGPRLKIGISTGHALFSYLVPHKEPIIRGECTRMASILAHRAFGGQTLADSETKRENEEIHTDMTWKKWPITFLSQEIISYDMILDGFYLMNVLFSSLRVSAVPSGDRFEISNPGSISMPMRAYLSTECTILEDFVAVDEIEQLGIYYNVGTIGRFSAVRFKGSNLLMRSVPSTNCMKGCQGNVILLLDFLNKCRHPNLLQAEYISTSPQNLYMLSTYEILVPLREVLDHLRDLSPNGNSCKKQILLEIVAALCHLDSLDPPIVHQHLHSNSVLVDGSGHPRLLDYWLDSKAITSHQASRFIAYHPPEVFGTGKWESRSDVYSFGILMWEVCCGEVPFSGLGFTSIVSRVIEGMRPEANGTLEKGSVVLMERCWHANRLRRPRFSEIHHILKAFDNV